MKTAISLSAMALLLTACGQSGANEATPVDVVAANRAEPGPPAVKPLAPAISGDFVAVSNTAMSVTGDVGIAGDMLRFGLDQDYHVGAATIAEARTPYADDDNWADLFGVAPDTPVEIHAVTEQRIGKGARNGGLCGPDKARFVAIARKAPGTPEEMLQIAAFQGAHAPGKGASVETLCGTFSYAPKTGAASDA